MTHPAYITPSTIIQAEWKQHLSTYPRNHFTACITDPPYGLNKISSGNRKAPGKRTTKAWDKAGYDQSPAFSKPHWKQVFRVLKPGAYCLSFGSVRTYHRMACAMEDAGLEICDCLMWMYGTGMPKTRSLQKELRKSCPLDRAITFDEWYDYGTSLRPTWEPIVLARKPLDENYRENILRHGVGGMNIGRLRVPVQEGIPKNNVNRRSARVGTLYKGMEHVGTNHAVGYHPRNILLQESILPLLNEATMSAHPSPGMHKATRRYMNRFHRGRRIPRTGVAPDNVTYPVSRFFYCVKPDAAERGDNSHPTVKPLALARYLVDMVTYPERQTEKPRFKNRLLDPCCGSGTFLVAAKEAGLEYHGCDLEQEYVSVAEKRLASVVGDPVCR